MHIAAVSGYNKKNPSGYIFNKLIMKKTIIISLVLTLIGIKSLYSQISFLGFDNSPCGLMSNSNYTYQNYDCTHGIKYRIFKNGQLVSESTCALSESHRILDMMFINETTGFIVDYYNYGPVIYKTTDSGQTWNSCCGSGGSMLGFFLVNQNTGYLIVKDPNNNLAIRRTSDINCKSLLRENLKKDIIITDTIFGNSFCNIDTLGFKIKNGIDTISIKIALKVTPLDVKITYAGELKIYPNPLNNYIKIDFDDFNIYDSKIKIYNNSGTLIKVFDFLNKNNLYLGDLKPGLYVIELIDNNKRRTCKIIKE